MYYKEYFSFLFSLQAIQHYYIQIYIAIYTYHKINVESFCTIEFEAM